MPKYKTKSDKVKCSTEEAEAIAKKEAEEAAQREAERLEAERLEAECQKQIWNARPGPVPIGWSFNVDEANGWQYYWQDNDPTNTTTWDRPAHIGEEFTKDEMMKLVEELRKKHRAPEQGQWQWAVQKLWMEEELDNVCNLQRPGSRDIKELVIALNLLRYFLRGPRRDLQDILLRTRHLPHEKLPGHLHNASAVTHLIELLTHDEADVRSGAACVLAGGCCEAHRGFQDAINMSGNAIPLLLDLLWDDQTAQAGALALGRACEHGHKGNQDAIVMTPNGATQLLDLIEHEDDGIAKTVQYAVFWANVNAKTTVKTHWDRSRGFCASLTKPRKPCYLWEPAFCRRHHLEQFVGGSRAIKDGGRLDIQKANNEKDHVSMGDKYLQLMLSAGDDNENPDGQMESRRHSKHRRTSTKLHSELPAHQAPNHAHRRLPTKRDVAFGHHPVHGDIYDERATSSRPGSASRVGSRVGSKADIGCVAVPRNSSLSKRSISQPLQLQDTEECSPSMRRLEVPGGSRPGTQELPRAISLPVLDSLSPLVIPSVSEPGSCPNTHRSNRSHRSRRSSFADSQASDHDLHHLDPGLDDQSICRIGQEVRHCTQTGFLKPLGSNKRYGICT